MTTRTRRHRRREAETPEQLLQEALEESFRHLSRADRTVAQMRRHLERRRVDDGVIDAAVAELERQGYLDDVHYARCFAEDRRTLDAWGRERIARRLGAVGIHQDVIETTLSGWAESDELDAAVALLYRRVGAPPATNQDRERALGLLLRRGYGPELAYDAVRTFERGFVEPLADCA
jgi:regulatory protein